MRALRAAIGLGLVAALLLPQPALGARKTISAPETVVTGEAFDVTGTGAEPGQIVVVIIWAKGCASDSTFGHEVAADGTWSETMPAGWSTGCTGEHELAANQSTEPFGFRRIARMTVTVE